MLCSKKKCEGATNFKVKQNSKLIAFTKWDQDELKNLKDELKNLINTGI